MCVCVTVTEGEKGRKDSKGDKGKKIHGSCAATHLEATVKMP